jgi:hypothetical protein
LLFRHLDGSLTADDLNTEGNAFAKHYYKSYAGDYERLVRTRFATAYHVPDDWAHHEWVAEMIEKRYRKWKAGRTRSSRR